MILSPYMIFYRKFANDPLKKRGGLIAITNFTCNEKRQYHFRHH